MTPHVNPPGSPHLFEGDPTFVAPDPTGSIQERFEAFHAANPWVYRALVILARSYAESGRTRLGIAALWERLRWEYNVKSSGAEFRLNDHYRSRYARLIIDQETDLADLFELRRLRTE